MNSQANKQLVIAAWQAFASRDKQRIAAVFTDDAEWLAPKGQLDRAGLALYQSYDRPRADRAFHCGRIRQAVQRHVKVDFRAFHAENDVVIVEERMQATLSNGHPYDVEYCFVFRLRNGLIERVRE